MVKKNIKHMDATCLFEYTIALDNDDDDDIPRDNQDFGDNDLSGHE